jgi:S1-C subfamily serine protease
MNLRRINRMIAAAAALFVFFAAPVPGAQQAALTEDEQNTIDVVRKSRNSVVFITNIQLVRDFWYGSEEKMPRGSGSGFVWDERGHIVTNYHVIEDGVEFQVTLPDQQQRRARLVGKDESKDIAVLKLDGNVTGLTPVVPGSSRDLVVGQKTIAIGNPFGLASTVTSGIVSAVSRFVPTIGQLPVPMIQTDAAINPGNSGGPLLDSRGQLIGINTAIINPQGRSFAGLGFAVPSNLLTESLARLEVGGVTDVSLIRPRLGIAAQGLELYPPSVRAELDLPDQGVAVIEVQPGSVAARSGILGSSEMLTLEGGQEVPVPGDIIVAIDGDPVDEVEDITLRVTFESDPGDEVELTIVRDGKRIRVPVTLEVSAANGLDQPQE